MRALCFAVVMVVSSCLSQPLLHQLCPDGLQDASRTLDKHQVSNLSVYFPDGEARAQEARYPSSGCATHALASALEALLASSSPESLAELSSPACDARCMLDRRGSMIGIVADDRSPLANRLLPLPPQISSVSSTWIFFVSVPDLGEHVFWALVPRSGGQVITISVN